MSYLSKSSSCVSPLLQTSAFSRVTAVRPASRSARRWAPGQAGCGNFTLLNPEEPLGTGGQADVYAGRDTSGQLFALKIIGSAHGGVAFSPSLPPDWVLAEAQAQRIVHKHVCRYFSLEHQQLKNGEGFWFHVLEYLPGDTLQQQLRLQGLLSVANTMTLAQQLLEGLQSIHEQGLVHLDLSPANLMFQWVGAKVADLKILDFGLAWRWGGSPSSPCAAYTNGFSSPEQRQGLPVERTSDVYSAGKLLLYALTGSLEGAALQRLPASAQALARGIEKAMRPQASRRFLTAAEMLASLQ